ncbi:MAG: dodecin domain-containing protein [Winogradskyella sp.]|uniref:dodecin n=1 Tax=Winogradskyella sp. TaxID=1883156 RepID=UPI001827DF51|nr:dodecin domain-containing protein [Winogradskyella sp.]
MSNHTYKKIEIVGSSEISSDNAVENALAKAAKSVKNMRWFEITESRGLIGEHGKVSYWQVTVKIGFTMED